MTTLPRIISFSSPKGGVGRTMVAANLCRIYAQGARWAGLPRTPALLIDMDFDSPGVTYYRFLECLRNDCADSGLTYRFRGRIVDDDEFASMVDSDDCGFLQWLSEFLRLKDVIALITSVYNCFEGAPVPDSAYESAALSIERMLAQQVVSGTRYDPLWHVATVRDSSDDVILGVMPTCGPSGPSSYSGGFDWTVFFERQLGAAVMDGVYRYLACGARYNDNRSRIGFRRIVIDQGSGETVLASANNCFADHRIIVSGLSHQNQAGLYAMLRSSSFDEAITESTQVVLSQYLGRFLPDPHRRDPVSGGAWEPHFDFEEFLTVDDIRRQCSLELADTHGISLDRQFLVDFHPEAVGDEFFFPLSGESTSEIIRLAVRLEQCDSPQHKLPDTAAFSGMRVLGEFVGLAHENPSGPLGALCTWLRSTNVESKIHCVAASHEAIAEWIDSEQCRQPSRTCDGPLQDAIACVDSLSEFSVSDFDILAIPMYLLSHLSEETETLSVHVGDAHSSDCLGPITDSYLSSRVLGWTDYCHLESASGPVLKAFPLFVEYPLIVANAARIFENKFQDNYRFEEQRTFRGFNDPADVLAVARAATRNQVLKDRLMMTLKHSDVAQWYEWQAFIAMFGADLPQSDTTPWQSILPKYREFIARPETVRATRLYLQLSRYADSASQKADWTSAISEFFDAGTAGMMLVWPDAIPLEKRTTRGFVYAIPPGQPAPEECWLLVVPRNRTRPGAPTLRCLERLLARFMTVDAQSFYQCNGGLSVHRSVLTSCDHWRHLPILPSLSLLMRRTRLSPRNGHRVMRKVAKEACNALDRLKIDVTVLQDKYARHREGKPPTPLRVDHLWYDERFVKSLEAVILDRFEEAFKSI